MFTRFRKEYRNESHVKEDVKKILKHLGVNRKYMPVPMGMGEVGVPDFLVCFRGIFVGIETKFKKRKLTQHQANFGQDIMEAGGLFGVFNEDSIVELEEWLLREWAMKVDSLQEEKARLCGKV